MTAASCCLRGAVPEAHLGGTVKDSCLTCSGRGGTCSGRGGTCGAQCQLDVACTCAARCGAWHERDVHQAQVSPGLGRTGYLRWGTWPNGWVESPPGGLDDPWVVQDRKICKGTALALPTPNVPV